MVQCMSRQKAEGTASEGNGTIVNIVHYQGALGRANRTQGLFNAQVKAIAPVNSIEFVTDLQAGLEPLKQAIGESEPFTDVEVKVHSEVHSNLQKVFNLQVIPEFPPPMLLAIPAIAGIRAATRINALRRK